MDQQTFFCKRPTSKVFKLHRPHCLSCNDYPNSAVHIVAINSTEKNGHGCVPVKFYLQNQLAGQIWRISLLNPVLCNLTVSMLMFLNLMPVLWLCEKIFLWFRNMHHGNIGGRGLAHLYATYYQIVLET